MRRVRFERGPRLVNQIERLVGDAVARLLGLVESAAEPGLVRRDDPVEADVRPVVPVVGHEGRRMEPAGADRVGVLREDRGVVALRQRVDPVSDRSLAPSEPVSCPGDAAVPGSGVASSSVLPAVIGASSERCARATRAGCPRRRNRRSRPRCGHVDCLSGGIDPLSGRTLPMKRAAPPARHRTLRRARRRARLVAGRRLGGAGPVQGATSPAGSAPNPAARGSTGELARADRSFVSEAAMAGMAEVDRSWRCRRPPAPRSGSSRRRWSTTTPQANAELMKLAQTKGVAPPAELDRSHRRAVTALEKQSGADFDRAYMKMQVSDHEKTVSRFEKQAKSGQDAELRAWAQAKLPTLRKNASAHGAPARRR